MKIKKTFLLFQLFILPFSVIFSQNKNICEETNPFLHCIYDKYDSIEIDIKNEMYFFEKYLINSAQLKDSTGQSYIDIFKIISNTDSFPITSNYFIKNFKVQYYDIIDQCRFNIYSHQDFDSLRFQKSINFSEALDSIKNTNDLKPSIVADCFLSNFDESDFSNSTFKFLTLYNFYFITNPHIFQEYTNHYLPTIEILIGNDSVVYINDEKKNINDLAYEILKLRNTFSEKGKLNYEILLIIDSNTKMGIVTDIKKQLRKANVKKIRYRTF